MIKQAKAKVIADSINPWGKRITTFELEYPRIVHSEFMTHRQFSRNASSSRAIPIDKVIQQVKDNPAFPAKWGKNQAGMQSETELSEYQQDQAKALWLASRDNAVAFATSMKDLGLHKQIVNRILEPYQFIKVVMTTTEYTNWEWLRLHKDADPTIYDLAEVIKEARDNSIPTYLDEGMWHVPYVDMDFDEEGKQSFFDDSGNCISTEDALKLSSSCCAQVSYRKLNKEFEKAEDIYTKLIESERVHASPTEHQGRVDVMSFASGNFRGGWVQYRQLIPNNAKH